MNYAAIHQPLFDSSLLLWEADKPGLTDGIWKACEFDVPADITDNEYVLDGALVPWIYIL